MDWNDILPFSISVSAITGAIIYIGKRIVDRSLDLAIERYRSKLALELETHKIKFGKLHPDRLEAIKLFQSKLYDLENALYHLTTTWQGPEWIRDQQREDDANRELIALKDLLEINQIYFNKEVCSRLSEIYSEGKNILLEMSKIKSAERSLQASRRLNMSRSEPSDSPIERWIELEANVKKKIIVARSEMTDDFRALIGVE